MDKFSFPFEPYDIQLSLMDVITRCIDKRKLGILESPTGTGKSMSIICATLTWLRRHEMDEKLRLEKQIKEAEEAGKDETDWVKSHLIHHNAIDGAKKAFDQMENIRKIDERLKKAVENTTNIRKRKYADSDDVNRRAEDDESDMILDVDFESTSGIDQLVKKAEEESLPKCTKIIYATRTHSQLQQFADEIMKTKFRPRMVTLGSRQHFCINESVRALNNASLMTERCHELRDNKSSQKHLKGDGNECLVKECKEKCPYARSDAIEDLSDQILAVKLSNVSQLVNYGKKVSGCPYFGSRKAVSYAQLILLPYQILLQEEARKAWGIDLKDNVVVIDEAHNLLEVVANSHSVTLHADDMQQALIILSRYTDRYRSRLKPVHLKYLQQLTQLTEQLMRFIYNEVAVAKTDHVEKMATFATKSYLGQYNLFRLLEYIDQTHLIAKLNKFSKRMIEKNYTCTISSESKLGVERVLNERNGCNTGVCSKSESGPAPVEEKEAVSPLTALKQFLQMMTMKYDDSRIIVECSSGKKHAKIRYFLINPAPQLSALFEQCRSVILLGGTMEPSDQLIRSLVHCCGVKPDDIIRRSYSHVISGTQLLAVTIGHVVNTELVFTYENRSTPRTMRALLEALQKIAVVVPNGVIVFFPSYGYLEFFMHKMSCHSLRNIKPIFIEERNSSSALFNDFAKSARTKNGALLFAVVGGKLSEGINFSDELGRAVVMVGLPFMNKDDVAVMEKMKYLDTVYEKGAGQKYYESKCMHEVNQSIGRVIRHRNDYAVIIMLDLRYRNIRVLQDLPRWIRKRMVHASTLSDGGARIWRFFISAKNCAENVI